MIRAISWNLFHGRDRPPDPALFTWRSRVLRLSERNATHVQVNRDLFAEFAQLLSSAEWDVALLQECPPRWVHRLAAACDAEAHISLTSRNSLAPIRSFLARLNPDLVASAEGGSNVILARRETALRVPAAKTSRADRSGGGKDVQPTALSDRRELVLTTSPERRTMAFARLAPGIAVANLHASNAAPERAGPEVMRAATAAIEWAGEAPLILGGDFNLRPDRSPAFFDELVRLGFSPPSESDAIDHLQARGLDVLEPPARWPPERREVDAEGLAIRLSDHAPVSAAFA